MIKVSDNPSIFQHAKSQYSLELPRENHSNVLIHPKLKITSLPDVLKKAAPKRQLHFLAGRTCAIHALALEGCPEEKLEIKIGSNRAPIWPEGFIGSITHHDGFASAVVAKRGTLRGIGLDAEAIMLPAFAKKISEHVASETELNHCLQFVQGWPFEQLITLLFSAKESIYKCLSPLVGKSFGFYSVEIVSIDLANQSFQAKLTEDLSSHYVAGMMMSGRFEVMSNRIHTSIELQ